VSEPHAYEALHAAIVAGDREAAEAAMREHLTNGAGGLAEVAAPQRVAI
jgi:DNA-binding FadR family transcriptional regulator